MAAFSLPCLWGLWVGVLASETDLQLGPAPLATSAPRGLACLWPPPHPCSSRFESECQATEFPLVSISPILPAPGDMFGLLRVCHSAQNRPNFTSVPSDLSPEGLRVLKRTPGRAKQD